MLPPPNEKALKGGRFSSRPLKQHYTLGGASLPCADMRDMRTSLRGISFSPRLRLVVHGKLDRLVACDGRGNRGDRVDNIRHSAQRVPETHGCMSQACPITIRHASMAAVLADEKQIQTPLDNRQQRTLEGGRFPSKLLLWHCTSSGASLPCAVMRDLCALHRRSPLDEVCRPSMVSSSVACDGRADWREQVETYAFGIKGSRDSWLHVAGVLRYHTGTLVRSARRTGQESVPRRQVYTTPTPLATADTRNRFDP